MRLDKMRDPRVSEETSKRCSAWYSPASRPYILCGEDCDGCGFARDEIEKRRAIPLTAGNDGLRRKLIPRRA